MSVDYDFSDRVVLIAGAGGPLGSVAVEKFRETGATVCASKRDPEGDDIDYDPDGIHFYPADFTDEIDVERVVEDIVAEHGRLDAFYNNVGEWFGGQPIHETELAEYEYGLDVNLRTAFLGAKHTIPHLRESGGALVNASARHSLEGGANDGLYRASKAGVRLLTASIAEENEDVMQAFTILPDAIDDPAAVADVVLFLCSDEADVASGAAVPV